MKAFVLVSVFLSLLSGGVQAQGTPPEPTDKIHVTGQIEKSWYISGASLAHYPVIEIGDVVITNHSGQPRGTAKQLRGVRVKDVLREMVLNEPNPKFWSMFYLVFQAQDGYQVVYSWNEIFNSPAGEEIYFITSKEGMAWYQMPERILVLTPNDIQTGRRHIKALQTIEVRRVQ